MCFWELYTLPTLVSLTIFFQVEFLPDPRPQPTWPPSPRRDPTVHLKTLFEQRFRSQEAALSTILESVDAWNAECVGKPVIVC